MQRHALADGTVLSVQRSADAGSVDQSLAVLFDGRPMIDAGIPETLRSLEENRVIGPLTTIYVESIEGSTTRGPTRVSSLTDPVLLDRLVQTLRRFLAVSGAVTSEPARRVVMGHSLGGNAALHVASRWPGFFSRVATASAALWWPGDDLRLSGSQIAADVQAVRGLRLWMQAGAAEDPELLRSNREFWKAADEASLDLVHVEHSGGHELSAWRQGLSRALPHLLTEIS
jgi:enterochelin esterase-like enzyme